MEAKSTYFTAHLFYNEPLFLDRKTIIFTQYFRNEFWKFH